VKKGELMEHDEMVEILDEIARSPKSYPSARISASGR
jgi:hypothetical protein